MVSYNKEYLSKYNAKWHIPGHPDLRVRIYPGEHCCFPHIHIEDMFTATEEVFSLLDCKLVRSNVRDRFRKNCFSYEQVMASERFIQIHKRELSEEYAKYNPLSIDKFEMYGYNDLFDAYDNNDEKDAFEEEDKLEHLGDVVSLNEVKIIKKRDGFGIEIFINSNDHDPAHVHIKKVGESKSFAKVYIPDAEPKDISDIKTYRSKELSNDVKETILRALLFKDRQSRKPVWQLAREKWASAHP